MHHYTTVKVTAKWAGFFLCVKHKVVRQVNFPKNRDIIWIAFYSFKFVREDTTEELHVSTSTLSVCFQMHVKLQALYTTFSSSS